MKHLSTPDNQPVRPTKKQKELLTFIESFIQEHGYSPSYREIMNGLNYNSVATVAVHINNLLARGHIKKRENTARSLEIVSIEHNTCQDTVKNEADDANHAWIIDKIEELFSQMNNVDPDHRLIIVNQLQILIQSLAILGLKDTANNLSVKLEKVNHSKSKQ